jgi:hypothetical protein
MYDADLLKLYELVIDLHYISKNSKKSANMIVVYALITEMDYTQLIEFGEVDNFELASNLLDFLKYSECVNCNQNNDHLGGFLMGIIAFIIGAWNLYNVSHISDITIDFIRGCLTNFLKLRCFRMEVEAPDFCWYTFIYMHECPIDYYYYNTIYVDSDFSSDLDSNGTCVGQ